MRILMCIFLLAQATCFYCQAEIEIQNHKEVLLLMGTRFEFTAIGESHELAQAAVQSGINEIQRIESLISSWQENSQTSAINKMAGLEAIVVEEELFNLIFRSLKISGLTDGAFDISFAGIDRLYEFDKGEHPLPIESELEQSISTIDFNNVILDRSELSVFLKDKGMKIGFGGIGKGYAANAAKNIMSNMPGITGGLVNAAGDLIAWGESHKPEGWQIQISNPENISMSIGTLSLQDMSIVTSGDYEKYFTNNGTRYAHIIDPKTGLPTTGIKSVSIICPDAELGDAIATSIFVLGKKKGMELINKLKNVEAFIISDNNDFISSDNLLLNRY